MTAGWYSPPALASSAAHFRTRDRRAVRLAVELLSQRSGVVRPAVVTDVSLAGAAIDDANMSGWRVNNANLSGLRITRANLSGASIAESQTAGMTIDGIQLADLMAAYRAAHPPAA